MNNERWVSTIGIQETLQEKLKRRRAYLTRKYYSVLHPLQKSISIQSNQQTFDEQNVMAKQLDKIKIATLATTRNHQNAANSIVSVPKRTTMHGPRKEMIKQNQERNINLEKLNVDRELSEIFSANSDQAIDSDSNSSSTSNEVPPKLYKLMKSITAEEKFPAVNELKNNGISNKSIILNQSKIVPKRQEPSDHEYEGSSSSSIGESLTYKKRQDKTDVQSSQLSPVIQNKRKRKRPSTLRSVNIPTVPADQHENTQIRGKPQNTKQMESRYNQTSPLIECDEKLNEVDLNKKKREMIKSIFGTDDEWVINFDNEHKDNKMDRS